MSRRLKQLTGLVLSFVMACTLLPYTNVDQEEVVNAAPKTFGVADGWDILQEEDTPKGTKTNPFVILEIVPRRSYAEIGYTIAGCEPVDIKRLESADTTDIRQLDSFEAATVTGPSLVQKFELEAGDIADQWDSKDGTESDALEVPGYYERVENGKGEFDRVINYLPPAEEGGEMIPEYSFVKNHGGDYKWVTDFSVDPDTEIPDYLNNNIGHRVILKRKGPYIESNRYIYENKDLFLKKV
ncbi:MAG: hypothetical protein PUC65_13540, partial [Clostridiales bacterium]|nr:hypothetical protein [Clostridiales bacterium]